MSLLCPGCGEVIETDDGPDEYAIEECDLCQADDEGAD